VAADAARDVPRVGRVARHGPPARAAAEHLAARLDECGGVAVPPWRTVAYRLRRGREFEPSRVVTSEMRRHGRSELGRKRGSKTTTARRQETNARARTSISLAAPTLGAFCPLGAAVPRYPRCERGGRTRSDGDPPRAPLGAVSANCVKGRAGP
jgi:hypothetical protein